MGSSPAAKQRVEDRWEGRELRLVDGGLEDYGNIYIEYCMQTGEASIGVTSSSSSFIETLLQCHQLTVL